VALSYCGAQAWGLAGAALGSTAAVYLDLAVTLRRVAQRTGVPLGELQDWRALGLLLLFSVLAAALAASLVAHLLPGGAPPARLALGGAVLAVAYAAMTITWPRGRGWLAANR